MRAAKAGNHTAVEQLLLRDHADPNTREVDYVSCRSHSFLAPQFKYICVIVAAAPVDTIDVGRVQRSHRDCEGATEVLSTPQHYS